MSNNNINRPLGRGLSSILGEKNLEALRVAMETNSSPQLMKEVPITLLDPGKWQPRGMMDPEELKELCDSIVEHGILSPILVQEDGARYKIIAGERRYLAARAAGLSFVPVVIKNLTDQKTYEIAILENIQRKDLSPMDEAFAYIALVQKFGYSQNDLAKSMGKSRSHIANCLRLLELPDRVKDYVTKGKISMGHAKVLVSAENAYDLANLVMEKDLSVRQLENLIKSNQPKKEKLPKAEQPTVKQDDPILENEDVSEIEALVSESLGMQFRIKSTEEGKGKIVVSFNNLEELDSILNKLT